MSGNFIRLVLVCTFAAPAAFGQLDQPTANGDTYRTNSTLDEAVLNTNNVNPTQFGKLSVFPLDGQVYAQPLYLHAFAMPNGRTLNVVYVATMHNSVYAFDADASAGTAPLWQVSLGPTVDPLSITTPGVGAYTDIQHEIGILSTPVIDRSANAIYVVNETIQNGNVAFDLHALDLTTGAEILNGPTEIQASVPGAGWAAFNDAANGQLLFIPADHIQRPALLEANGMIYIAFGSHGDYPPWHGWVMAYSATSLQQTAVFSTTPSGEGAAVWQAGRGLAVDTNGDIFLVTANGDYTGTDSWGESILHLTPDLQIVDWFTPAQFSAWTEDDVDFGSNGPILIPGGNRIVAAGKAGIVALADSTNLGEENALNSQAQVFQAVPSGVNAIYNTALWNRPDGPLLYVWGNLDVLRAFRIENGAFNTTAVSTNSVAQTTQPYGGMMVSSNSFVPGTGILWVTSERGIGFPAPGTLHAFDASDVRRELWNSDVAGRRDTLGNFSKFANPTVANGKVYVPTDSHQLVVYGLLDVPGVTAVTSGASFGTGAIAPGELITIFGIDVGPSTPAPLSLNAQGNVSTAIGGVKVDFDGAPAPLLYASANQINAVVPFEIAGQSSTVMRVTTPYGRVFSISQPVAAAAPAVFTLTATGSGQGAILNSDLSVNSPSHPAARGSIIAIYATGTGALSAPIVDGELVPYTNLPLSAAPVTVIIGGQPATVSYQGSAPGLVAGVMQINAQVPAGTTPGAAVPVTISVAGVTSPATATVAVQ